MSKMVMLKRGLTVIFLISFLLIFVNLASASFTVGSKDGIDTAYGPNENVRGWINISFDQEPSDSLFTDSKASITLIDLLKKRATHVYSCNPVDCNSSYTSTNAEIAKTFNISQSQSKTYGIRLTGDIAQINPLTFDVTSNAQASCVNQISIDFLDDGVVDVINDKVGGTSCASTRSYGCFNSAATKEELQISQTPYCQRINLPNAQAFKLGAVIKKNSGVMALEASLYDGATRVANCNLPDITGETSCDVTYNVPTAKDYYVCISSVSGSGDYKINSNTNPTQGCGFFGQPPPTSTPGAYEIFAESRGFGAVGNIHVNNTLSNGKNLANMAYNYIISKYGGTNCSNECIIPVKITAGVNQQVTISSLNLNYQKGSGVVTDNKFYDLATTSAKITSGFSNVYVDGGNFTVPNKIGTYNFNLKLNGKDVVTKTLNVTNVPTISSISPTSTAAGFPTDFTIYLNGSSTIKRVFWDFGDNSTDLTQIETVRHTYNSTGTYLLSITTTDTRDLSSSKTFTINVTSPKDLINTTLVKIRTNVNTLQTSLNTLNGFSQESVKTYLGVDKVNQEVTRLQNDFNVATTDTQYSKIINDLVKINNIPKSVAESKIAPSIIVFPDRDSIDLEEIKSVAGGDYNFDDEEAYKDAIILWNQENIDTTVTFRELVGNYGTEVRPIIRTFELNIKNKGNTAGNYFLFVPKLENIGFAQGTPVQESNGYYYVDLGGLETVSFYTTQEVDFTDLPFIVSPGLNRLTIVNPTKGILAEAKPRWVILILALIFLMAVGLVVYIVLQEWYKRRYENYLFKNRNDLYNMVNYIHNSKNRGLDHDKIEENLRKAKWKSEQIKYVMKKYAGKRTGMFEIPVFKWFRKKTMAAAGIPPSQPGYPAGYHKKI